MNRQLSRAIDEWARSRADAALQGRRTPRLRGPVPLHQTENPTARRGFLWSLAVTLVLAAILCGWLGCSKRTDAAPIAGSRVLTAADVRQAVPLAFCGDATYAEVNSAVLPALYDDFRAEVFRRGVTKWDARFDCNHFAGYFVALAQTRFYLANFQSRTPAQTLALGTFWYQSARGGHAIVVALTERGRVFLEPQTGAEVKLTPAEENSAWLREF